MPTPKRSGIPGWALLVCAGAAVFTVVVVVLVGGVVGFIVIKNNGAAPIASVEKPATNDDGKKPLEKLEDKKPLATDVDRPDLPKDKGIAVTPVPTDGFVSLFNGKDLTGCKKSAKFPGDWVVVHGVLTGLAADKTMSRLQTERAYSKDIHLRAEMRISEKGAGKVGFRSPDGSLLCYEAPFANIKQGGVRVGSLHSQVPGKETALPSTADAVVAPGEWFTFEAIAQGNRLVIKVNGKTTTDVLDSSTLAPGYIVLGQLGPSTFEVRKIEIKELNVVAAPPIAPADGFVPLFNGNDLTGWKNSNAPGNWRVVNGISPETLAARIKLIFSRTATIIATSTCAPTCAVRAKAAVWCPAPVSTFLATTPRSTSRDLRAPCM